VSVQLTKMALSFYVSGNEAVNKVCWESTGLGSQKYEISISGIGFFILKTL